MKKKIGILFQGSKHGGLFQYSLGISESLINNSNQFDCVIFYFEKADPKSFLEIKNVNGVKFICLSDKTNGIFGKLKTLINIIFSSHIFTISKENYTILNNAGLDLLIFPTPTLLCLEVGVPFIVFVPDIMHKYYPGFPEYKFWERIKRDLFFKNSAKHSIVSVVDSQQGLEDLHKFYNIDKKKISIIPCLPPGYIFRYQDMDEKFAVQITKKYNLPDKFLFYPAQFWFHKNHLKLVEALYIIKQKTNTIIPIVLAGGTDVNTNNYNLVRKLAKELAIENQILYLGYVSDKEIVALYKRSTSLVFPTLIGPTSIPPIEAMILGTPVLCSNLFSMPEQIGDAGLLFNPFDVNDMADKIYKIWTDESLRKNLISNGFQKTKDINVENYAKIWEKTIEYSISKIKNYDSCK